MQYLTEITRLIDGALKGDRPRVIDYTKLLATKLEKDGDARSAKRLSELIARSGSTIGLQHASPTIPVDGESRFPLADETVPIVDQIRLFLDPRVKQRIDEFLMQVRCTDDLIAAGVGVAPTMLLYGPPGNGKSMTAAYIAASLDMPLLTARIDTLVSSFLGSTSKNIRFLFEHASRRPCVLFLDELDSIGKLRDDQHEMGELKRVVISLLQNIDKSDGKTVLLAATNHPHMLDRAIGRRFQFHLNIDLPSTESRVGLISDLLSNYSATLTSSQISELTDRLSCAEIVGVINDAIRDCVIKGNKQISEAYLLKRIIETKTGTLLSPTIPEPTELLKIQMLNQKILTVRRLGCLFGVSGSTINRQIAKAKNSE